MTDDHDKAAATPYIDEPARRTPVVENTDVVVCGGGPAGVAAALAAARAGARVRLLEVHGCLGGIWTAGLLSLILDRENKTGIMPEIVARLDALDARRGNVYDPEMMKLVLEDLCREASIDVRLHTRVAAAARDADNRLAVVVTESKSAREAWAARCFIDCTGDGDLAAHAGCGFDLGHPDTGDTQPMSLMCLLTGVAYEALYARELIRGERVDGVHAKHMLREEMQRAGIEPSYARPTLLPVRDDLIAMMANHEYGVSGLDAQQITDATLRARREVHEMVRRLRDYGGVWANVRLVISAEQVGVREGRRIHGRYTVSEADLAEGRTHDDAVCRVRFNIDVHSTNPQRVGHKGIEAAPFKAKPYDIPYRALIARDVDALLMAGRCISGDFLAHSSYRVTGNAVAMGQAAGAAGAVASLTNRLPHALDLASDITPLLATLSADSTA